MFKFNFLLALLSTLIASLAQASSSYFGTHGMVLFGGENGLFASHLPMYHRPHNVQMIMQFHFRNGETDEKMKRQLQQQATQTDQLWTIVPKPFDLMRLDPMRVQPVKKLQIDVVKGHFERGGETKYSDQEIIVDKIILFTELSMEKGQEKFPRNQYLKISADPKSVNQFLVKRLEVRPEADHILRVLGHDLSTTETVNIPSDALYSSINALEKILKTKDGRLIEIYLEVGELQ